MSSATCLAINRHHQDDVIIKECKINTSQFTNAELNINNGRYKCKNVGTIESMIPTYLA